MLVKKFVFILVIIANLLIISCSNQIKSDVDEIDLISTNSLEPQNVLVPTDTIDLYGYKIIDLLFSRLVSYDENNKLYNEQAEYIKTDDNQHYIVKIRENAKFSDGTDVKSHNFVNAWNLAVAKKHKNLTFFDVIKGYPENNEEFKTLSGLKIIDDKTFSIDLKYKAADFISKLSNISFSPLSDKDLKNIDTFGNNPTGNGPYKLASENTWIHNKQIILVPNEAYQGPRKAQNKGVLFRFYTELSAAYADLLAENLDVLDIIPNEQLLSYAKDLKGRFIKRDFAALESLLIDYNRPHFGLNEEGRLRRKAISMAIDRKEIANVLYANSIFTPAKDFTSLALLGSSSEVRGSEVLEFNPKKARELWEQADKIYKFNEVFTIEYNNDDIHKAYIDAIVNSLKIILDIKAEAVAYPDFKSYLNILINSKLKIAGRNGWVVDYPSILNFFKNFLIGAASNYSHYNNLNFDKLVHSIERSQINEELIDLSVQSQEILFNDMPSIPLFYENIIVGHSSKVSNVKVNLVRLIEFYNIKK